MDKEIENVINEIITKAKIDVLNQLKAMELEWLDSNDDLSVAYKAGITSCLVDIGMMIKKLEAENEQS